MPPSAWASTIGPSRATLLPGSVGAVVGWSEATPVKAVPRVTATWPAAASGNA